MARLDDLKSVRETLGKSQSELSALLGISTRAVQSYEQGWRPVPPYVQKLSALLLYLNWRKDNKERPPCWELRRCSEELQEQCTVRQSDCGHLCWMISGNFHRAEPQKSWKAKWGKCLKCPVTKGWLRDA